MLLHVHRIPIKRRARSQAEATHNPGQGTVDNFSLYLFPDRLRWYSLGFGIIPGIPLLPYGEFWHCLWVTGLAVLWVSGIYPFLMFFGLKKRVLEDACRNWREDEYRDNYHVARLKWLWPVGGADTVLQIARYVWNFLPSFRKQTDPIAWSKDGSVQEAFIRLAINDLFFRQTRYRLNAMNNDYKLGKFISRSLKRIMVFWASPVIAGLMVIVAMLISRIYLNAHISPIQLALSILLWLGLSAIYIMNELRSLYYWAEVKVEILPFIPPGIRSILDQFQDPHSIFVQLKPTRVINLVFLFATGILLALVAIIKK
jgi:hypothetical protein